MFGLPYHEWRGLNTLPPLGIYFPFSESHFYDITGFTWMSIEKFQETDPGMESGGSFGNRYQFPKPGMVSKTR
jgi:hypothetical protein